MVKRSRQGLLDCTDHFSTAKVHALGLLARRLTRIVMKIWRTHLSWKLIVVLKSRTALVGIIEATEQSDRGLISF